MISLSSCSNPATWVLSLKNGEIRKLLADPSFKEDLENGVNDTIIINSFCLLSCKIYKMKNLQTENIILDTTLEDIFNISKLFCIACKKCNLNEPQVNKILVALYHIISHFLDEGSYEFGLTLLEHIFIFCHRKEYFYRDKTIISTLKNLSLKFWNGSIVCEKNASEESIILDLRFSAIKILCHTGPNSLAIVSDRFSLITQKYISQKKGDSSEECISTFFCSLLETMTVVVNDILKFEATAKEGDNTSDMKEDSLVTAFKPFCQILTEVILVYNLFGKLSEGFRVCSDHCRRIVCDGKSAMCFCNFLEVLQDIWTMMINSLVKKTEQTDRKVDFKSIYLKVCIMQNNSDKTDYAESEVKIDGITFKSSAFITATESLCVALVDTIPKPSEMVGFDLSIEERNNLYKLLKLSAKLSYRSKSDDSALKAAAVLLRFIIHELNEGFESKCNERSNELINEAKDALELGLKLEENMSIDLSYKGKVAIRLIAWSLQDAMEMFMKWECFEEGELFCSKYCKFALKRMLYPDFAFLKSNNWWALKNLYICYVKLEKFREALSPLVLAMHRKTPEDIGLIFKEWVKVKIKARLSDKVDQLKLSTVYHLLKENVPEEEWQFTEKDLCYLLRLEINAYRSKNVCLSSAIKDACHTLLEISMDPLVRAEAQLYLLEFSWQEYSPLYVSGNSLKASEKDKADQENVLNPKPSSKLPTKVVDDPRKEKARKINPQKVEEKDEAVAENDTLDLKHSLRLCERLVDDLTKEMSVREKILPEDVPIILCLMAQTYYWKFLCLFHLKAEKGQKELNELSSIPLKAVTGKEDDNINCDVVTNQQSLKSSTKFHLLKSSLNIALSLWEEAMQKGVKCSHSEVFRIDLMLKYYLQTTAYIYELYNDVSQRVIAWSLLCEYAVICDNDEAFLLGASNLMRVEIITLNESFLKKSAEIADKINVNSPSLLSYLLGKSWQHLLSYELPEGLNFLKKFLEKWIPYDDCFNKILYAQAKHLLALYFLHVTVPARPLPPELIDDPIFVDSSPRDSAISAIGVLVRILESWNASESLSNYFLAQSLLLDVSEWLGEFFIDLNFPREAYGFLKEQFQLAQKLLLPNRTAWFLSLLARVDIMCQNIRDCEVKLKGMEMILDLVHPNNKDAVIDKLETQLRGLKVEDSGAIRKTASVQKKVVGRTKLAVSKDTSNLSNLGSSPELPKSRSSFLIIPKCSLECICPWCTDSAFQKAILGMVLVKTWVLFESSEKDLMLKFSFSEHSDELIKTMLNRHKELTICLEKRLGKSCIDYTHKNHGHLSWNVTYVRYLLHLVDYYASLWEGDEFRSTNILKASETNNRLAMEELKIIPPQFHMQCLQTKAILQKITISSIKLCLSRKEVENENKDIISAEVTSLPPQEGWKTPERKDTNMIMRKFENKSSDDEVGNYEPVPDRRIMVMPCLNLVTELEKEEEIKIKKKATKSSKAVTGKKVVTLGANRNEKAAEGKVMKSGIKKNSAVNLTSNASGKSLDVTTDSKEKSIAVENEDFISDSPDALIPVTKFYKRRYPIATYAQRNKTKAVSANSPKTATSISNVPGNDKPELVNASNSCDSETESLSQLLGATSLNSQMIPEKTPTLKANRNPRRAKLEGNDCLRKIPEADGKSTKTQVKQSSTSKPKTKKNSFIDSDSETETLVSRKAKPKRLPRNPFIKL